MSFSTMAYVLVDTLRRVGLRHSQFADAAVETIRLKLLKLGAQVRTSVRRIHFAIASGCPNKDSSNSPTSTFSVPSGPSESRHAAKTPGWFIAVLARPDGLALREAEVNARAQREHSSARAFSDLLESRGLPKRG